MSTQASTGVRRRSFVHVPHDWERVAVRHFGAFVTSETFRRPDGSLVHWNSRAHRKRGRGPLTGSMLWAPRALAWWIAVLFMLGSACFAIGPLPVFFDHFGYTTVTATFFVGSLFFTSAALLQYIEVVVAPRAVEVDAPSTSRRLLLGIEPQRVDWWASAVQLVGTVFFNVTTFAAFLTDLTVKQERRLVWSPDALGSVCFLIASWLAYIEVGHRIVSWQPRSISWWIGALNLVGSIAFGVSAIASFVRPATGDAVSLFLTNLGTFIGALCFFAGAALLLPERVQAGSESSS
jgi:hypothetical protein